jgi:hypothetical protein
MEVMRTSFLKCRSCPGQASKWWAKSSTGKHFVAGETAMSDVSVLIQMHPSSHLTAILIT